MHEEWGQVYHEAGHRAYHNVRRRARARVPAALPRPLAPVLPQPSPSLSRTVNQVLAVRVPVRLQRLHRDHLRAEEGQEGLRRVGGRGGAARQLGTCAGRIAGAPHLCHCFQCRTFTLFMSSSCLASKMAPHWLSEEGGREWQGADGGASQSARARGLAAGRPAHASARAATPASPVPVAAGSRACQASACKGLPAASA